MQTPEVFSFPPMLVLAPAIVIAMLAIAWVGGRVRTVLDRKAAADPSSVTLAEGKEGYVVSSVLGLLALLMGFSFALAVDRFEDRRAMVLAEANAIGTTYLRAQLLDEPHRSRISRLLVAYTDNRIAIASADTATARTMLAANDQLVTDLWTATVAAFPTMKSYDMSSAFLETMNAVIDLDAARKAGRAVHLPTEVLMVLLAYLLVSAGILGYVLVGKGGRVIAGFLLALFLMSLLLIIDIDQPTTGGIIESQEAMVKLRASLASQPPAVFDRFNTPAGPAPAP